jgi:3-isopropylmalate dehydrogenase
MMLVRDNIGGVYQGSSAERRDEGRGRVISHSFSYVEADVRRFLAAACRLAQARRGKLTVVTKEAGLPGIAELWRECAQLEAAEHGVECRTVDFDLMAYWLVRRPHEFDVIAAPNLCGDVLGDLAAALVGSRGMSFSGNYTPRGEGVYQTNHGAAYELAGTDRATPAGQILSAAMLLRESLGLDREADAIEVGLRQVWRLGHRPADLELDGATTAIGTREMGELVAESAAGYMAERVAA